MNILDIPNELLLVIGEYLSIKDLYHILSTCRQLLQLFTPRLYNLGVQDVHGLTALQWAAKRGHTSLAELAISRGADVDKPQGCRTGLGRTPLHSAAEYNHPAVIRILINNGASITSMDIGRNTPLHLAAQLGNEEATRVLLELGADMTCHSRFDEIPVFHALRSGSVSCVKAFIDSGLEVDTRVTGRYGETIIHIAATTGSEMMEYLLGQDGAKAAINAQDSKGGTPLHVSMHFGARAPVVRLLLQNGADMEAKDNHGDTPAHRAVHLGIVECLVPLIEAGFDTNIRTTVNRISGRTILHEAVIYSERILSYLLGQEGGRVIINAQDSQGSTPLHLAANCGFEFDNVNPMFISSRIGKRMNWEKMVRLLVKRGADPEMKDSFGNTPTHIAAYRGNVGCMKSLIRAGFDFNTRGLCGRTTLHGAVFGGLKMMEYLLKQKRVKTIINAQDDEGSTPLDLAERHGLGMEVVGLLLRYGAKKREKDSHVGRDTPHQDVQSMEDPEHSEESPPSEVWEERDAYRASLERGPEIPGRRRV